MYQVVIEKCKQDSVRMIEVYEELRTDKIFSSFPFKYKQYEHNNVDSLQNQVA